MQLDDTRKQILAASGHLLIQGGPGSGKTTIALLKAARTLETLAAEQHVIFLSFSRAAVRQISDRVGEHLPLAIRPHLEVRTFHAFFLDFVRSHGHMLTGTSAVFLAPDGERQRQADHEGDWDTETIKLASRGIFVFDQLAATTATLLERSPALRALYSDRYPLVIVDEFQDTNVDQWRVIQALADTSTVICLADPDQRIYEGFVKGVDEERLQHAVTALRPTPFDLAGDNHRSAGNGILDYGNAVLRNSPAEQPASVQYVRYSFPHTPEVVTHHVIVHLQALLAKQLGREPTIVVLGPSSAFVAGISEAVSAEQTVNGTQLPAVDHELVWDPVLAAAAGYVVASILEWPTLPRDEAITTTLRRIADFYRVKFTDKQAKTARSSIKATNNAIQAFSDGKTPRTKTGKSVIVEVDNGIQLTGNPVTDWQLARARLRGSTELSEIFDKARMLRLLHATDALAWGLADAWDGQSSYPGATEIVRRVLADELVDGRPAEPRAVTLMNMHKSKGKEFDGVIIAEGVHTPKLIDPDWDEKRIIQQRRVIRVAITRARHKVFFVRPKNAFPLVPRSQHPPAS